jgi:hypothetical protein
MMTRHELNSIGGWLHPGRSRHLLLLRRPARGPGPPFSDGASIYAEILLLQLRIEILLLRLILISSAANCLITGSQGLGINFTDERRNERCRADRASSQPPRVQDRGET